MKTHKFPFYDKDLEILDKSNVDNRIIFEAVDILSEIKNLRQELNLRKLDYKE